MIAESREQKFAAPVNPLIAPKAYGYMSSCALIVKYRKVTKENFMKEQKMSTLPPCPECQSTFTYEDRGFLNCPTCGHEWSATESGDGTTETGPIVRDANGTLLQDGDTVTVIKDLRAKGSSAVVKVGTKVKNIRLVAGDHNIDCKVPGIGDMGLKSEFVKKVSE